MRNLLAWVISWKAQKLLYSKFFGVKTKEFVFKVDSPAIPLMLRAQRAHSLLTWLLLIPVNLWVLVYQINWGTQMFIMLLENIILSIVFVALGLYEHKRMTHYFGVHHQLHEKSRSAEKRLHKRKMVIKDPKLNSKKFELSFVQQK